MTQDFSSAGFRIQFSRHATDAEDEGGNECVCELQHNVPNRAKLQENIKLSRVKFHEIMKEFNMLEVFIFECASENQPATV